MLVPTEYRLKNTIKYPTTIIIGGLNNIGIELAMSLLEQGGYVVIVDTVTKDSVSKLEIFGKKRMLSFLDYSAIPHLEDDIRRVDYVFYFNYESIDYTSKVSTQEFLTFSNYLDATLSIAAKFKAKFLLASSIKAHQMLLSDSELGLTNLDTLSHTVYTDMEIQRYAEGLVIEYERKVDLDARIVRLGEVIGEDVEFSTASEFMRLILNGAEGNMLELTKDGLETEWFVHVKDATYGLIKAQFTKKTKGKVYSLAYDSSYSHLSLAYKIQDINGVGNEIRFVETKDNMPPLRPYKPAPNLSDIGWMPKVSFDRAVKQSLAAAKLYLAEEKTRRMKKKSDDSFSDRLKSFMTLAKKKEEQTDDIFETDADRIAKIAAEKKRETSEKKQRIHSAGKTLKLKRGQREKSGFEKSQDQFWRFFSALGSVFGIFRKRSPLEITVLIFVFALFIFAYFTVIAPGVYVARNAYTAKTSYDRAFELAENKQYGELASEISEVREALDNIDRILSRYDGVAGYITLEEELSEVHDLITIYGSIADGLGDIAEGLSPLSTFVNEFENNTERRTGTESYLTVSGSALDFRDELETLEANQIFVDSGIDQFEQNLESLKLRDTSVLPEIFTDEISKINGQLFNLESNVSVFENELLLTEFLGGDEAITHLLLVLDNTRPTMQGGDVAAFALITVSDGGIIEVVVQSADEVGVENDLVTNRVLEELNNTRFTYVGAGNTEINDIAGIRSFSDFGEAIIPFFEEQYNRDIETVFTLDLNGLENLVDYISSEFGTTPEVQGVSFGDEFLASISDTQPFNESLETKHKVIAQLTSFTLFELLENLSGSYTGILDRLSQNYENGSLSGTAINNDLIDLIEDLDLANQSATLDANSYVRVGVLLDDSRVVNIDRYPDINLALNSRLVDGGTLRNTMNVSSNILGVSKEIATCFPRSVTLSSVNINGVDDLQTTVNSGDFERCAVVKVTDETEFTISWEDFGIGSGEAGVFRFGVGKIPGVGTSIDYTFVAENGLNIVDTNQNVSYNDSSVSLFKDILRDEIIQITLGN